MTKRAIRLPRTFSGLNVRHPLRPIQNWRAFRKAQRIADPLAVLNRRTKDQDDYLETLSILMEKFENECDVLSR